MNSHLQLASHDKSYKSMQHLGRFIFVISPFF
jgi:hypothetical protein